MAGRNIKTGLTYFPLDVDFFSDIKIRKLIRYQGARAITIYMHLLCNIYKDGYFMKWDNELPFIISEATGYDENYISAVIYASVEIDLFSKELFEKGIITSKGIQDRYKLICELSKRKSTIRKYSLISSEQIPISSEQIPIDSELMPENSELMQQRKEKESKEKESKENKDFNFSFELLLNDENWHSAVIDYDNRVKSSDQVKELIKKFFDKQKLTGNHFPAPIKNTKEYFINWLAKHQIVDNTNRLDYEIGKGRNR